MNEPRHSRLKLTSAVLAALGMSLTAGPIFAQEEDLEEVVVTGTLIKDPNLVNISTYDNKYATISQIGLCQPTTTLEVVVICQWFTFAKS